MTGKPGLGTTAEFLVRVGGLALAVWETVADHADRPVALIVAAVMMGIPEYIKTRRQ